MWYFDRKREYSVKSGYYVARGWKNITRTAIYTSSSHQWSLIWNLKVPPKVRIFLWRALSDLFPNISNLMLKRVVANSRCKLCGSPGELVLHALFVCDRAFDVWDLSLLTGYVAPGRFSCFRDVLDNVHSVFSLNEVQLFVLLMWGIWG